MGLQLRPCIVYDHKPLTFHHCCGIETGPLALGVGPLDELRRRLCWRHVHHDNVAVFQPTDELLDGFAWVPIEAPPIVLIIDFRRRLLPISRCERGDDFPQTVVWTESSGSDNAGIAAVRFWHHLIEYVMNDPFRILL